MDLRKNSLDQVIDRKHTNSLKYDFTKWFHDLYRPNHHPYDPKEIEQIKYFCALADYDFEKQKKTDL